MNKVKETPRITLTITEDQKRSLDKLPYGDRKKLFSPIIQEVCDLIERHPRKVAIVIAMVSAGELGVGDLSSVFENGGVHGKVRGFKKELNKAKL